MEMLLKITTTPTEYELRVTNARLERSKSSPPVLEMSREKGGLTMHSKRATLRLDTYEARNSVIPTLKTTIRRSAQRGLEQAASCAQRYSQEAAQMKWSKPGEGGEMLSKIFEQRMKSPTGDFKLGFIPTTDVNISYQPGNLETQYQMDRLTFDFKANKPNVEYIPGSVDMVITQMADVKIEYIGDPIYVPPSAKERFLGKELDVSA